jgi:hypothetical protein
MLHPPLVFFGWFRKIALEGVPLFFQKGEQGGFLHCLTRKIIPLQSLITINGSEIPERQV